MTRRQSFWFNIFSIFVLIAGLFATLNAAGCIGGKK